MIERSGIFEFAGKDAPVLGEALAAGQPAPEALVQNQAYEPVSILASTAGKVRIIAAVPSLDTSVCDRETRRFNVEAAALGSDIAILVISMAMRRKRARWCGAAGVTWCSSRRRCVPPRWRVARICSA